jgi:hypothetical protein
VGDREILILQHLSKVLGKLTVIFHQQKVCAARHIRTLAGESRIENSEIPLGRPADLQPSGLASAVRSQRL